MSYTCNPCIDKAERLNHDVGDCYSDDPEACKERDDLPFESCEDPKTCFYSQFDEGDEE